MKQECADVGDTRNTNESSSGNVIRHHCRNVKRVENLTFDAE